ncbi:ABC transporter substrate-binding protein [Paracoccus sp. Z330]|uniref:sn-glycerol-3-phosphate-binding periplasmic protein UgpB n=1 Tax=Paracoccus onchidii TaxID=3017813 RepID=A0ABT4ZIW8_9RHOB|nr:ABC transporter substrate-binding protein [Paracoccus onchidii]MDB6179271.1 ABC transporter substrate-binding protein [Paracoccus onchidii]
MSAKSKLRGMTWDHPRGYECVVAASAAYERETGVSIQWDKRSLQAFADAPIDQLARDYDFIVLDHPHVGLIAEQGALLPLAPPQDSDAGMGGSPESYFWNGACWAYAIDAACQMAVCRPDLTDRLPHTWEDLSGPEGATFRAITPLLPVDAFDMMMTLVAGRGEENLPHGDDQFTSDANSIYALNILKALYRLGPSEAVSMNPIKVLEALSSTDEFAMSPCLFGYVNYARPGFRPRQLRYFDLPVSAQGGTRRAILGGAGIGVSAQTADPEAARSFAAWLASERVQSGVYLENEGQPANRHSWQAKRHDPAYRGFFEGGWSTMDNAWTRPRAPWFLGFVDDVCEMFPAFFLQDRDAEAFLAELNSAFRHHYKGK